MRRTSYILAFFLLQAICFVQAQADKELTRVLFILDASGSMQNLWDGKRRMDVAKDALIEMAIKFNEQENVQLALRVYGHQYVEECTDSKLEVSFAANNLENIKKRLETISPKGTTPIAYSVEKAAGDFPQSSMPARNIIIIITDGFESCKGNPCEVSLALQKKNIFLKPFVIGFAIANEDVFKFSCMGTFYNATSTQSFRTISQSIFERTMNKTSLKIDLLDVYKKPTETDINMTLYDASADIVRYNYYHTMNFRGASDPVPVDPINTYNLVVHTTPPVERKDITIQPDVSNTVSLKTPQGYLELKLQSMNASLNIENKIKCLVYKQGTNKTVEVQEMNTVGKYLVGHYDLEMLTLPRVKMPGVQIAQSKTTTIQIPSPGLLTILKNFEGYGSILLKEGTELKEVYQLKENVSREVIALQPGKYKLIFRSKYSKTVNSTIEKDIDINSGTSVSIKL